MNALVRGSAVVLAIVYLSAAVALAALVRGGRLGFVPFEIASVASVLWVGTGFLLLGAGVWLLAGAVPARRRIVAVVRAQPAATR